MLTTPTDLTILEQQARASVPSPNTPVINASTRPSVQGKFLFAGDEKFIVKGVTYGTFRPGPDGGQYDRVRVETDFAMMAAHGFNAVRVYTAPPRWLLDNAQRHGLRVMVGLAWEQHIAFLDNRTSARAIPGRLREEVRAIAGHPAILCFSIGNEIPGPIVRWYGTRRIERFLKRLAQIVRDEDPGALVTYVTYPPTEYLALEFLDFVSFNVYLESPEKLEPYLARLQNLAGDKPLVMAEVGLDSYRNGEQTQAETIAWQIYSVFTAGCTGVFVYAWTDEWHAGGWDMDDWAFGLVDRTRTPKPALHAAETAYSKVPFTDHNRWPRISIVICSYNGSRTIADALDGVAALDYPDYETIVVDDGSTDNLAEIASRYSVRLIRTENQGLSAARNEGMRAATGEIVAYLDDDARPDPHWLRYLADMYERTDYVAVGGPNIAPAGDGFIAEAVAHAPGGPVHVLVTDTEADHLPGCNLSVRRDALLTIGGFDPRYRVAGDDVDVCWRLQEAGGRLGYSPGAMIWHHRRNSAQAYWRQQEAYGKAEALLEDKWPQRYDAVGHRAWPGRIYGHGPTEALKGARGRVYQGVWGSALFPRMYQPAPGVLSSLTLMPEWWLLVLGLAALGILGLAWSPLLWAWPLLALAIVPPVAQAENSGRRARIEPRGRGRVELVRLRALIAWFHLVQPLARLRGRIRFGLTPWRLPARRSFALPWRRHVTVWTETSQSPEAWLGQLAAIIRDSGTAVRSGGAYDRWDLEVRVGALGTARILHALEEHGKGRQLARFRITPRPTVFGTLLMGVALALTVFAVLDGAWIVATILGLVSLVLAGRVIFDTGWATGSIVHGLRKVP